MSSLGKKRLEAVLAVTGYVVGGSAVTAVPTPCVEIPKQIVVTASDILMYTTIWKIYFEEDLAHKQLVEMLVELGLITVVAAGAAYIIAKGSTAILSEITDWVGPVGWSVSAIVSGSLTGLFGAAWALHCDSLYCQQESQSVEQHLHTALSGGSSSPKATSSKLLARNVRL